MECVLPERNYSGEAMTDTTELRKAAKAATPGPWELGDAAIAPEGK